jgi:hypothetical protein
MMTFTSEAPNVYCPCPRSRPYTHSHYIGPERQLIQPLGHRPRTTQEAATEVVDELHVALRTFKHTKLKKDFLHMIERALYLQKLGYRFTLDRKHNCVGARRQEVRPCAR